MKLSDILKLHGIEANAALESAITEYVDDIADERVAKAAAESGKDNIPKSRFDEVNEARKSLLANVKALEKELAELNQKTTANASALAEIEQLRGQVESHVTSAWAVREKLLDDKAPEPVKQRIAKLREKLVLPEKGGKLTVEQMRQNLDVFRLAEEYGGAFEAPAAAPPADGKPPVTTTGGPQMSPFAKAFEAFNQ